MKYENNERIKQIVEKETILEDRGLGMCVICGLYGTHFQLKTSPTSFIPFLQRGERKIHICKDCLSKYYNVNYEKIKEKLNKENLLKNLNK
jgi:hypothetical protein